MYPPYYLSTITFRISLVFNYARCMKEFKVKQATKPSVDNFFFFGNDINGNKIFEVTKNITV